MHQSDTTTPCPFNTEFYARGLSNIGEVEMDPTFRIPVLRRPIAGTTLSDGVGPWPYLWIENDSDIEKLYVSFRHLVTLSVVTQPGYIPKAQGGDAKLLKQHYVYDPSLPRARSADGLASGCCAVRPARPSKWCRTNISGWRSSDSTKVSNIGAG